MSEVMLTIMDADRAIHGSTHGSHADRVVAALSAEPETIEELEAAVARFIKPRAECGVFEFFDEGVCEEPWDAGAVSDEPLRYTEDIPLNSKVHGVNDERAGQHVEISNGHRLNPGPVPVCFIFVGNVTHNIRSRIFLKALPTRPSASTRPSS